MTEASPKVSLLNLIRKDPSLASDHRRLGALMRDLCPDGGALLKAILTAQQEGIARIISSSKSAADANLLRARLIKKLTDELGLRDDIANQAVEAWLVALGRDDTQPPVQNQAPATEAPQKHKPPPGTASTPLPTPVPAKDSTAVPIPMGQPVISKRHFSSGPQRNTLNRANLGVVGNIFFYAIILLLSGWLSKDIFAASLIGAILVAWVAIRIAEHIRPNFLPAKLLRVLTRGLLWKDVAIVLSLSLGLSYGLYKREAQARLLAEQELHQRWMQEERAKKIAAIPAKMKRLEAHIVAGQWEEAARLFEAIRQLEPDQPGLKEAWAKIQPRLAELERKRALERQCEEFIQLLNKIRTNTENDINVDDYRKAADILSSLPIKNEANFLHRSISDTLSFLESKEDSEAELKSFTDELENGIFEIEDASEDEIDEIKRLSSIKLLKLYAYMVGEVGTNLYEIALPEHTYWGPIPGKHAILETTVTQFSSKDWFNLTVEKVGRETVKLKDEVGGFTTNWNSYREVDRGMIKKINAIKAKKSELKRKIAARQKKLVGAMKKYEEKKKATKLALAKFTQPRLKELVGCTQTPSTAAASDDQGEQVTKVGAVLKKAAASGKNSIGIVMVNLGHGTFLMGSPSNEADRDNDETKHRVTLTRPFLIAKTELTQGQWQAVMGSNPSHFNNCGSDCPVEQVSWDDAIEFLNKLSDKEGLSRCYSGSGSDISWVKSCTGYRLPTEAEWEYAARAGTTGARHGDLDAVAWYSVNSDNKTHPVGAKQSNAWGLHDMLGNVWEWVWDWKAEYPTGNVTDPGGSASGSARVFRGGGWGCYARLCRSALRSADAPGYRIIALGFRPARSVTVATVEKKLTRVKAVLKKELSAPVTKVAGRYVVSKGVDGLVIVLDEKTGLTWTKEYWNDKKWQQAIDHCEGLSYAGHDDWRLPTKDKLDTLLDKSLDKAPYSTFPDMPSTWFWSSSSHASHADNAWYVNFGDGFVSYDYKYNAYAARCVRP